MFGRPVEAGYATLAVDRVGTGGSRHPPAAILTLDAHVAPLAAVVTALREGRVADTAPNRIVTVGHSLGSAIVAAHAVSAILDTDVGPVDGSILTGFSHLPLPISTNWLTFGDLGHSAKRGSTTRALEDLTGPGVHERGGRRVPVV
jgi:pimeloyl-ACP methyl ester carboxylesterase